MTSTARQRASKHAERTHCCSCGARVNGNGGRASHFAKHERARDGHRLLSYEQWRERWTQVCDVCAGSGPCTTCMGAGRVLVPPSEGSTGTP